jgi:hypothetical protein
MPRQTVAVIIPTKNVAAFFRPTLESIRFVDEVIVVDMLERINALKAQKGIKDNARLARESGIPYTTLVGLYDRGTDGMRLGTLRSLARYFEVTMDYLADGKTEIEATAKGDNDMTFEEMELIKAYRDASDETRGMIKGILICEARRIETPKKNAK